MRLLFSLFFIGLFSYTTTAQIKWNGSAGDELWSNSYNWVGNVVPGPGDDVVLDNEFVTDIYYQVVLPVSSSVSIKSIEISPNPGSTIVLLLPSTNEILNNAFVTTGSGNTVVINSGGSFQNKASVTSGTNLDISGSMKLNDGGSYIHSTQSEVYPWITNLSTEPGTSQGIFIFDVPASTYSVSLGNITFGALNFSSLTYGASVNYEIHGTGQLTVQGSLNINDNTSVAVDMADDIIIQGALWLNSFSVFDMQKSSANNVIKVGGDIVGFGGTLTESGSGAPQLQLNGSSHQQIFFIGSVTNNVDLHINKPLGNVNLNAPLTLPHKLTLTKGKIMTNSVNILTLADDATSSGGSSLSFVQGPMRKAGDDDFIFPIGTGAMYTPIGMYNVSGQQTTDIFTAEYKRANPQSTYGMNVNTADLNHVSYVEYWKLTQDFGSAIKNVSLAVHEASFCKNLEHTYVCRWNGAIWNKESTVFSDLIYVGLHQMGTITTTAGFTDFTAPDGNVFTLGTDLNFILNPLPVNLVAFSAKKTGDTKSLIEWELAECCSAAVKFEIERAGDNGQFKKIQTIRGSDTDRFYSVADNDLPGGINYYRLKIIDENGYVTYSKTVTVINGIKRLTMILAPAVANDKITLTIASETNRQLDIYITDIQGKVVRNIRQQLSLSGSQISVMVDDLTAGMYYVVAAAGNERANTLRFIKQ